MAKNRLDYTKFILPNGVKCILYKRDDVHSINISTVVNVGSLDETDETNGISHFIEHLPFDGTEELDSWTKVNDYLNNISGSGNAYTTFDHTKFYGTFPSKYLKESIYYISQLVLHPLFRKEDIEKERVIIIDEQRGSEDSIGHKIYRSMIDNRFVTKDSSFSYDIIGTKKNLKRFKRADILANYQKHYVPENMEVYIVGNFDEAEAKKLLEKYYYEDIKDKEYGSKPARKFQKEYPAYSKFKINTAQKLDLQQYYLIISFPTYEFALTEQKKRHLIDFLSALTASSQYLNSVLWQRLREELGIVYGVNSWTHYMYNRAFFAIETSFNPEFLETVMREIYVGVNKILNEDVTDDIFKTRQKRIIDTELMRYDNPTNVLSWIVEQEDEYDVHKKNISIPEYLELVKNYKFKDVLETSKDTFKWEDANITVVSQDKAAVVKKNVNKIWEKIINEKPTK